MVATRQVLAAYNRWSRNIFPFSMENCVLYVPFWQEDTQGSTILSYDRFHHSTTVTGATWGAQGRQCNGTSDVIHIPDHANLKFGTGPFTVWIWVKTSQDDTGIYPILFSKDDEIATRRGWTIYQASGKARFSVLANTLPEIQSTNVINDGNWHFLMGKKGAVNMEFLVDNVSQGTLAIPAGTTDKAIQVNVGGNDNAGRWSSGLFGECGVEDKELSISEATNKHLVTKWRYQ